MSKRFLVFPVGLDITPCTLISCQQKISGKNNRAHLGCIHNETIQACGDSYSYEGIVNHIAIRQAKGYIAGPQYYVYSQSFLA